MAGSDPGTVRNMSEPRMKTNPQASHLPNWDALGVLVV